MDLIRCVKPIHRALPTARTKSVPNGRRFHRDRGPQKVPCVTSAHFAGLARVASLFADRPDRDLTVRFEEVACFTVKPGP